MESEQCSVEVCSGVVNTARFSRVPFADHKVKWHRCGGIQIQQEPAGNYHSVADCRNKANKSLQKNVTCVASMDY